MLSAACGDGKAHQRAEVEKGIFLQLMLSMSPAAWRMPLELWEKKQPLLWGPSSGSPPKSSRCYQLLNCPTKASTERALPAAGTVRTLSRGPFHPSVPAAALAGTR